MCEVGLILSDMGTNYTSLSFDKHYFIVLVSSCFLNTYLFYWIVSIIFVPLFQPLILICHSYFNACVRSILNQETTDHTNDVTCYLLC